MTTAELARAMGLDPAEYEKRRAPAGATSTLSLGASRDASEIESALDTLRLCRAFNIAPADFAKWRASQLQLAQDRNRRREPLTYVQEALLADETPPATVTPIVPTAEERTLAHDEAVRRAVTVGTVDRILSRSASVAPAGRTGNMKMISRAVSEDGTR